MYRITSRYDIPASLHLVLLTRQMLKASLGVSLIVISCAYFVENLNDSMSLYCRHVVHSAGSDGNTEWRFLTSCPQALRVLKERLACGSI